MSAARSIHVVRCACGVIAQDRSLLPEPCKEHGEVAVIEVVRASDYEEALRRIARLEAEIEIFCAWAPHQAHDEIAALGKATE